MKPLFHPVLVNDPIGDPGVYVDCLFEKRALLFDLGDISRLAPRKILRLTDVFVSHAHMDHFMGFDWLVRLCLGRGHRLRLFGPPGFVAQVEHRLAAYTWNLVESYDTDFTLDVLELLPDATARRVSFRCRAAFRRESDAELAVADGVLLDEETFLVRGVTLDHKTPCLAFALEEKQHLNVWKNRLEEMGLPTGPWLKELKRAVLRGEPDAAPFAVRWRDREGAHERAYPLGELKREVLRIVPGQKIAYVTDVLYHEANAERIVRLALIVATQVRQQIHALDLCIRRNLDATCRQRGRQDIELNHRLAVDSPRRQSSRPFHQERNANSPFERCAFRSAQWVVARGVDGCGPHRRPAVIADEKDQSVFLKPLFAELGQHLSDCVVHRRHHGGVGSSLLVANVFELFEARVVGLHRRVDGVKCQAQKEWVAGMAIDKCDRLAPQRIGEIFRFLHPLGAAKNAAVVAGEIRVRPAQEPKEFIEPTTLWMKSIRGAQMPLTDQTGDVSSVLEPIGDRDFRSWQSLVRTITLPSLALCLPTLPLSLLLPSAARIEFVAEPRLVAAGQQPGSRRRAIRPGNITVRAANALGCKLIDVRRRNIPTAVHADIGVSHVVAHDHDDVGLRTCSSRCGEKDK